MTPKRIITFMFILMCAITTIQIFWISMIHTYLYVTAGISHGIFLRHLYQYPFVAFSSTMPTLIFIHSDRATKIGWRIRLIAHFLLTVTFTILSTHVSFRQGWNGGRYLFEAIMGGEYNVILAVFAVIYIGAIGVFNYRQKKLGEKLTDRIKAYCEENNID